MAIGGNVVWRQRIRCTAPHCLPSARGTPPALPSVFRSERGSPLSDRPSRHIILRVGLDAQLPFPVQPPMLRHAWGFSLAHKGIDTRAIQPYLGHRPMQPTVRYTALAPQRFRDFWNDCIRRSGGRATVAPRDRYPRFRP
jgi:site-specific recombinase XerD